MLVHLGRDGRPWLVRASLMAAEPGAVFLLQLAPAGGAGDRRRTGTRPLPLERPDRAAARRLRRARSRRRDPAAPTAAFLDLVQARGQGVGARRARCGAGSGGPAPTCRCCWPTSSGTGPSGGSQTTRARRARHRDRGRDLGRRQHRRPTAHRRPAASRRRRRAPASRRRPTADAALGSLARQVGKTPLRELVRDAVGTVERHYIDAALELTRGNRTAAAELLGLSRQSLYAKLNRYGLDGGGEAAPTEASRGGLWRGISSIRDAPLRAGRPLQLRAGADPSRRLHAAAWRAAGGPRARSGRRAGSANAAAFLGLDREL